LAVGDELAIESVGDPAFELSWSSPEGETLFAAVSLRVVGGVGGPACPEVGAAGGRETAFT